MPDTELKSLPSPKGPPSPTTIDEGPTIGVLEPEMFTGMETIVVPSEPDLTHGNSADLCTLNEERVKFQFSVHPNNITFHRRFPQVDPQERLINYYSCALQADILLQGFLYITENYFAFYSNILGLHKTKLLVPVCDVRDITKEKTAIIIPNAVGIVTHEGKYVFGSLLSRETTYRLMVEVWKNTISSSFQMDTFPFDHLRPSQETATDNGNSSPSTPTKKEVLEAIVTKIDDPSGVNIDSLLLTGSLLLKDVTVGQTSSLERKKLFHRAARQGFQDCSDTSSLETVSDLEIVKQGAERNLELTKPHITKPQSKVNVINNIDCYTGSLRRKKLMFGSWKRGSIKSLRERLKSDLSIPLIHIAIVILLTYLLIFSICMIHRISLLQNLFESLTSNPKVLQRIRNNLQVEQIRLDLSENMIKMDDLKSSMLNLLYSVEKVFNANCPNPRENLFTHPSMLNTCSSTEN